MSPTSCQVALLRRDLPGRVILYTTDPGRSFSLLSYEFVDRTAVMAAVVPSVLPVAVQEDLRSEGAGRLAILRLHAVQVRSADLGHQCSELIHRSLELLGLGDERGESIGDDADSDRGQAHWNPFRTMKSAQSAGCVCGRSCVFG